MAYTTPAATEIRNGGRKIVRVTFTGTSLAAATEVEITGLPEYGRILRIESLFSTGTGANYAPVLGTATGPTGMTQTLKVSSTAKATKVDEVPASAIPYYSSTGSLFYRGVFDAGSDNVESVAIYIAAQWVD